MASKPTIKPYTAPSGGWGSINSLGNILAREGIPISGALAFTRQNKPGGFDCVSCAWPKPADPHPFEFCENGAKATAWEITTKRVGVEFFAQHTLAELREWRDHDLEKIGRLTHPMRYDEASDKYVPVAWQDAFDAIGAELKALDPKRVIFYTSGRSSLETSYMWQLYGRLYGTSNFPDCSNMCHETTSVAMPKSIGVPKGTVTLEDMALADCIMIWGQNPGANSPRALNDYQAAHRRGVPILTFNPLRERSLERFASPQHPTELLPGHSTPITSQYNQLKAGGDLAAMTGICKAVLALDDAAVAHGKGRVLDVAFIAEHTHGFEAFADFLRGRAWPALELHSGLTRNAMEATAAIYSRARHVVAMWGMGLTQHVNGVENVQMLLNLLLMRGNMGKPGAGASPVRGHSNVQGQRTVGITEKPELASLDQQAKQFGFEPCREKGLDTIETCEAMLRNDVDAFLSLGGNFVRAVPDTDDMEPAMSRIGLTVMVSTKLNRNHLVHGKRAYILPPIGRIEIDRQATGPQAVSMEDSTSCVTGSRGLRTPASKMLLSEPAIVAGMAKATLAPNPNVPWDRWVANYDLIRNSIEETFPEKFKNLNEAMWEPGGYHIPSKARHRVWATENGKANFLVPKSLPEHATEPEDERDVLTLMTLRSNDQFNTTIYGYHDRFRGIKGTRMVLLIHRNDMTRLQLNEGDIVALHTVAEDKPRTVQGFRVTPYNVPEGCVGAYYPECNPLLPIWHKAVGSNTPAAKSIPIRVTLLAAAEQTDLMVAAE